MPISHNNLQLQAEELQGLINQMRSTTLPFLHVYKPGKEAFKRVTAGVKAALLAIRDQDTAGIQKQIENLKQYRTSDQITALVKETNANLPQ